MTEETQDTAIELVSSDLCGELIALLGDRLTAGEPLIAPAHFQYNTVDIFYWNLETTNVITR